MIQAGSMHLNGLLLCSCQRVALKKEGGKYLFMHWLIKSEKVH